MSEYLRIRFDPKAKAFEHALKVEDRFYASAESVERAGTSDDPLVWYAIQTNPNCEARAELGLLERGFVAYLPREVRWHRPTRRGKAAPERVRKARPLMIGYLFVGMCGLQSIYAVRQVDGVRAVVGVNGSPVQIPDRTIQKLLDREERGFFDETRPVRGKHKAGDKVTITTGPFADRMGEVLAAIEDGKLRVEVAGLFGVGVPVELDDDHVEPMRAA